MARFVIAISRYDTDIVVNVERDGKFYDIAEFRVDEKEEFRDYMRELTFKIYDEVR